MMSNRSYFITLQNFCINDLRLNLVMSYVLLFQVSNGNTVILS